MVSESDVYASDGGSGNVGQDGGIGGRGGYLNGLGNSKNVGHSYYYDDKDHCYASSGSIGGAGGSGGRGGKGADSTAGPSIGIFLRTSDFRFEGGVGSIFGNTYKICNGYKGQSNIVCDSLYPSILSVFPLENVYSLTLLTINGINFNETSQRIKINDVECSKLTLHMTNFSSPFYTCIAPEVLFESDATVAIFENGGDIPSDTFVINYAKCGYGCRSCKSAIECLTCFSVSDHGHLYDNDHITSGCELLKCMNTGDFIIIDYDYSNVNDTNNPSILPNEIILKSLSCSQSIILSISPSYGGINDIITIYGKGFHPYMKFYLAKTECEIILSTLDIFGTKIECKVPFISPNVTIFLSNFFASVAGGYFIYVDRDNNTDTNITVTNFDFDPISNYTSNSTDEFKDKVFVEIEKEDNLVFVYRRRPIVTTICPSSISVAANELVKFFVVGKFFTNISIPFARLTHLSREYIDDDNNATTINGTNTDIYTLKGKFIDTNAIEFEFRWESNPSGDYLFELSTDDGILFSPKYYLTDTVIVSTSSSPPSSSPPSSSSLPLAGEIINNYNLFEIIISLYQKPVGLEFEVKPFLDSYSNGVLLLQATIKVVDIYGILAFCNQYYNL